MIVCVMREKISFIIPTLNAGNYITRLLDNIFSQTVVPDEVLIVDSQSDDQTVELCRGYPLVRVIGIRREDFDIGGTRNLAIAQCTGEIILMMSQDVLPVDTYYIENLLKVLNSDDRIAACSGRQIAYSDAPLREKYTRQFNYKDRTFVRDKSDIKDLGIKTYFLSDCCAAYKRAPMEEVGMYGERSIINGDMVMAAKLLDAGYKIAYAAEARVYHSHDYSMKKQYARNFDIGADFSLNEERFACISAESEGVKLVKYVVGKLLRGGHFLSAAYYCVECAVRLKAYRDGRDYKILTHEEVLKRTTNPNFWKRYYQKTENISM